MFRYVVFSLGVVAVLAVRPVVAQSPTPATKPGVLPDTSRFNGRGMGVSVGQLILPSGYGGLSVLGFQILLLKQGGNSSEFSVYTAPQGLWDGIIAVAPKISIVAPSRHGDTWFILKAGANGVFANGGAGLFGLHAGIGMLLPASPKTSFRIEIEPHFYPGLQVYPPALLVSFGIMSRPR